MLLQRGMSNDDYRREVEELRAELAQRDRLIEGMHKQLAKLLDEVAKLSEAKKPKRGKKQKESSAKGGAAPGDSEDEPPSPPPRTDQKQTSGPKGVAKRQPLPEHLERQVEPHELDHDKLHCCATPLLETRDPLVHERKDYVPASVQVRRFELHRAQCVCCGRMHTAPTPPMAMPNGSMTAALIAFIVYGKCRLHLPLKRIIDDLATKGLRMAKATMSNVMRHAATLLTPIYDRIVAALFSGDLMHLDGTGVKTLQPGETGTHRGQYVVYCNAHFSVYAYSPDKSGKYIQDFLKVGQADGYRGRLVADAANNMDCLYKDGTITECGCWYHARDKFETAAASAPHEAAQALAWMGTLFDVERDADQAGDTAAERRARRKRQSIPLLRGFYRWMRAVQKRFPPDEDLYKAIQYCLNHWRALTRFMTDGAIPMTNNLAERELGVIGRGRKNWLFAGSDAGGEWLAVLFTVVRTCERLGVSAFEYLRWVLPKLSDLPVNRGRGHLSTLTPMAYAAGGAAA